MVRRAVDMVTSNDSSLNYIPRVTFPKGNVECSIGKNDEVKAKSCAPERLQPKTKHPHV